MHCLWLLFALWVQCEQSTVTKTSSVSEFHTATPTISASELPPEIHSPTESDPTTTHSPVFEIERHRLHGVLVEDAGSSTAMLTSLWLCLVVAILVA